MVSEVHSRNCRLADSPVPCRHRTAHIIDASLPHQATVTEAIGDKYFKKGLRYYCNETMALENLMFYEQAALFRRGVEGQARRLCLAFVREGSPSEVNITSKQRQDLMEAVVSGKGAVSSRVFDVAQEEILGVLEKDIFPRFAKSNVCKVRGVGGGSESGAGQTREASLTGDPLRRDE